MVSALQTAGTMLPACSMVSGCTTEVQFRREREIRRLPLQTAPDPLYQLQPDYQARWHGQNGHAELRTSKLQQKKQRKWADVGDWAVGFALYDAELT